MKNKYEFRLIYCAAVLLFGVIGGCAPQPFEESSAHIKPLTDSAINHLSEIPDPVLNNAFLPPPNEQQKEEQFTVLVHDVPVKELLFALGRDSKKNVDIAPGITGSVSLNAIDQTLPQILQRLKRQISIRYRIEGDTLIISPDTPYFVQYSVPYINLSRTSENEVSIATQVASTGRGAGEEDGGGGNSGGGNSNSSTQVKSLSAYMFWETLLDNLRAILREQDSVRNNQQRMGSSQQSQQESDEPLENSIIAHQETGIIAIRATQKQHAEIRHYIDNVLEHAHRQVLIEATIVEVELFDEYQTGVDWTILLDKGKLEFTQSFADLVTGAAPSITPASLAIRGQDVLASIKMLDTFGNSKVLSSPKLMVLNNQSAILKVVKNEVYFTTSAQTDTTQGVATTTFETELHTVPVGLVMNVTPQISSEGMVIINARPTISRNVGSVPDPHPGLADAGVESLIPVIEVREMESILKIYSGDIGVIGGLMQDVTDNTTQGTPGLSRIPYLDNLFSYKDKKIRKTELVIFLRPRVIKTASLQTELKDFNEFLQHKPVEIGIPEFR